MTSKELETAINSSQLVVSRSGYTTIMDLAKLENNQFRLTSEYFDLTHIINESFQMMIHMANENNIKLEAAIDKKSNLALIR